MNNITIISHYESVNLDHLSKMKGPDMRKHSLTYVEECKRTCCNIKTVPEKGKRTKHIIIPELMRCIGVCMHVLPKPGISLDNGGLIGFHISPVQPTAKIRRKIQKHYFWLLKQINETYDIPAIYVGGGRKNNATNKCLYDVSLDSFIHPLAHVLPNVQINLFETFENTQATLLALSKQKISAMRVNYDSTYYLTHIKDPIGSSSN
ncbi:MAG TPA: hypothetical protein PK950_02015 [Candidatus Paceibacterota bacterium]|nr:hypothetical protein [Candidatus Paceibacterota bacterium]